MRSFGPAFLISHSEDLKGESGIMLKSVQFLLGELFNAAFKVDYVFC